MRERIVRKFGQMQTLEQVRAFLDSVVARWCHEDLKKKNYYGDTPTPLVTYEVGMNEEKHIVIRIKVRYGPFGTEKHVTERVHYSIYSISWEELENQLLHTLTFTGSPFYFYKSGFKKYMEVIG